MMPSADLDILGQALKWLAQGRSPLLVTVVATWGSSPRPPGSMLAMCADGLHAGSVSGGCVEEDLLQRAQAGEWQDLSEPAMLSYGINKEEANRFGLPCGGQLDLLIEPLLAESHWLALYEHALQGQPVQRTLEVSSGDADIQLRDDPSVPAFRFENGVVQKVFGPQWRMLLIGANHLARYVAQFAQALDYQVLVCDPREEYLEQWDVEGVIRIRQMPDDAVRALEHFRRSIILTLTHDPKLDDMALMEALEVDAFYVGALGSHRSSAQRRERMQILGIAADKIERLHAPVGMAIGSRTPAEIAIAIMAEITALRNQAA
ncbi:MAG: XdhC family protein [Thiolinea sp.]